MERPSKPELEAQVDALFAVSDKEIIRILSEHLKWVREHEPKLY